MLRWVAGLVPHGGSIRIAARLNYDVKEAGNEAKQLQQAKEEARKNYAAPAKYHSDQAVLLQLQSTLLSKALTRQGMPLPTLRDVSTVEDDLPANAIGTAR